MINRPGIFYDMDEADYFADPCPIPSLTQSIAKVLLDRSPAHARLEHPWLTPPVAQDEEKYDSARAIGNAAHAMMIGRGKKMAVGDFADWRTKEARAFKAEAVKDGRVPILSAHLDLAHEMVKAAREQLARMEEHQTAFLAGAGDGEIVLAWQEGDIWLRTMIDWYRDLRPSVYDYKTTGLSCAPHVVAERPSEIGWDIQAAMHERGLNVLRPEMAGRHKFYYVAQENEAPFALSVVEISEADLTMGRKKLNMAIDIWTRCLAADHWPAYPAETILSRPKGYLETKWLEREVEHHERKQRGPMLTSLMGG